MGLRRGDRLGVLTSGGDAPGMNAALRAVARVGAELGLDVVGVEDGYTGLLEGRVRTMDLAVLDDAARRGGTVLGTARSKVFPTPEGQARARAQVVALGLTISTLFWKLLEMQMHMSEVCLLVAMLASIALRLTTLVGLFLIAAILLIMLAHVSALFPLFPGANEADVACVYRHAAVSPALSPTLPTAHAALVLQVAWHVARSAYCWLPPVQLAVTAAQYRSHTAAHVLPSPM